MSVGTMLGEATMAFQMNGTVAEARGNRHPFLAPHGAYPCDGDDKWAAIAVETAEEWRALCGAIGRADLADDPSLAAYEGRAARRTEIDAAIAAWTRERSHYDVTEALQAVGVAATPCLDQEGRFFDPHLQVRECYVDTGHPVLGSEPLYGIPYKPRGRPGALRVARRVCRRVGPDGDGGHVLAQRRVLDHRVEGGPGAGGHLLGDHVGGALQVASVERHDPEPIPQLAHLVHAGVGE